MKKKYLIEIEADLGSAFQQFGFESRTSLMLASIGSFTEGTHKKNKVTFNLYGFSSRHINEAAKYHKGIEGAEVGVG